MFEHPDSLARVMRERFEERARKGAAIQAARRELAVEPRWRRTAATTLRSVADRLDGRCEPPQRRGVPRTDGR